MQFIAEEKFGYMVSLQPPNIVGVKITAAIGRLRSVSPDGDIVQTARTLGVSFGDELTVAV